MIGRTFSHYRIVSRLGVGGMGTVYRAEDTLLGRAVALKFPHAEIVRQPAARARFLREARAYSALDHPNIVTLYDVCDEDGEVFIAMQCVEGRSLRDRLEAGPIALRELLAIGRAVADALAHAHARGVVHRDIKPDNILLEGDGRVKVADFGTARILDDARTTQGAGLEGTPAYLPPEVLQSGPADARGDLYALGVVLYEMIAGAPPFAGDHVAALTYQVVHAPPPPLPPAAPLALQDLVEALLAKTPEQRPATAVAVADALARLGTAGPGAAPEAGPPQRSLAVLPFENLTGSAEDDYFCAGIGEDLLTEVLKVPDLKVASRTRVASLTERPIDLRRAARELGVATVLEGGVRRAGGRVRVTARLVGAETGYQMWAERYDRVLEDIFEVQEDIARNIAAALRVVFEPGDAGARLGRRTANARAYDLRLRGLAHYRRFEQDDMREAIRLLEAAVAEDEGYALARADLAEAQVQMVCKQWDLTHDWLDRAEAQSAQALAAAPSLPEAHRALGHVWIHRRRLAQGLREFHAAVDLDPHYVDGLLKLGNAYLFASDASRGEIYVRRALAEDPRDPRLPLTLACILLRQGRTEECREFARLALALNPGRLHRLMLTQDVLLSHARDGHPEEAERVADEARRDLGDDDYVLTLCALAAAFAGKTDVTRALLAAIPMEASRNADLLLARCRAHVLVDEREAALAALEHAERHSELVDPDELRTDPQLALLREDPRMQRILAAIA